MPPTSSLTKEQKKQVGRLSAARWKIRDIEKRYAELAFDVRRDIHRQGAKARFLLAGILQHSASDAHFTPKPLATLNPEARGPHELCPVIDIYENVRIAQMLVDDWIRDPDPAHTTSDAVEIHCRNAERVVWEVQVFFDTISRGGDQAPLLVDGTETLSEFCDRIYAHHSMVMSTTGYDGRFMDVPSNEGPLSSQQIADNWNAVCGLVRDGKSLEDALHQVRKATRNMTFQELAWTDQVREWFEWTPKLEAQSAV